MSFTYTGCMDPKERKTLGEVIRALREANGLSRPDLAKGAGLSVDMIAKVEQGAKAPSATKLASIAGALGVLPRDLSSRAAMWATIAATPNANPSALTRIALGDTGNIAASLAPLALGPTGVALSLFFGGQLAISEVRDRARIERALRLVEERLAKAKTAEELEEIAERLSAASSDAPE